MVGSVSLEHPDSASIADQSVVPSLRVLVVDDDATTRLLVRSMLAREGHQITVACDGQDAIEKYLLDPPDVVLMDVNMPVLDGHEATRRIKQFAGEAFIPVIFLTAEEGSVALARCLEVGGDDFVSKPVNAVVLKAKMAALERIRKLNSDLLEKKKALHAHGEETRAEMEVAEEIFKRISNQGSLDLFRHHLSPASLFNGDLAMSCATRAGGQRFLLGDFTGHGLPAAVGAIPLADIFYAMTTKGSSISDVVREANRKLRQVLPLGMFCAAAMIEIDPICGSIAIWNGGLPAILMRSADGELLERFESTGLALGVAPDRPGYAEPRILPLVRGATLYGFTDGLPEAENARGEAFGMERVEAAICAQDAFNAILQRYQDFVGNRPLDDDLSLLEIDVDRVLATHLDGSRKAERRPVDCKSATTGWSVAMAFSIDTLRSHDPVPFLMHAVAELRLPESVHGSLFTVVTELFVNSLDHGLLRLDSSLKSSADGFARYFIEREERLAQLTEGEVRIEIRNGAREAGGQLTVRVEDDGPGFDWVAVLAAARERRGAGLHGRGLALLLELCENLEFGEGGRLAEATLDWTCQG